MKILNSFRHDPLSFSLVAVLFLLSNQVLLITTNVFPNTNLLQNTVKFLILLLSYDYIQYNLSNYLNFLIIYLPLFIFALNIRRYDSLYKFLEFFSVEFFLVSIIIIILSFLEVITFTGYDMAWGY